MSLEITPPIFCTPAWWSIYEKREWFIDPSFDDSISIFLHTEDAIRLAGKNREPAFWFLQLNSHYNDYETNDLFNSRVIQGNIQYDASLQAPEAEIRRPVKGYRLFPKSIDSLSVFLLDISKTVKFVPCQERNPFSEFSAKNVLEVFRIDAEFFYCEIGFGEINIYCFCQIVDSNKIVALWYHHWFPGYEDKEFIFHEFDEDFVFAFHQLL